MKFTRLLPYLLLFFGSTNALAIGCIGEWPDQICDERTPTPRLSEDQLIDQIVCIPVDDQEIYVFVQSNPVALNQHVSIRTDLNPKSEIGSFEVPADQPLISTPGWSGPERTATYEVPGLELTMAVEGIQAQKILGAGHVRVTLPDALQALDAKLECRRL